MCYKIICRLTPAVFVNEVEIEKTDKPSSGKSGLDGSKMPA
jgi:hypothetical protein